MTRITITSANVTSFEDGLWLVQAHDADGREYTLGDEKYPLLPLEFSAASRVSDRVKEAGDIDPALWGCRAPYGTNAWIIDGMEEREIEDERLFG